MFVVPELAPGETIRRCITLRYSGDRPSRVALSADVSGALADQLRLDGGPRQPAAASTTARASRGRTCTKARSATPPRSSSAPRHGARTARRRSPTGSRSRRRPTSRSYDDAARPDLRLDGDPGGDGEPVGDARARPDPGDDADGDRRRAAAHRAQARRRPTPSPRARHPARHRRQAEARSRPPSVAATERRPGREPDGFIGKLRRVIGEAAERAAVPAAAPRRDGRLRAARRTGWTSATRSSRSRRSTRPLTCRSNRFPEAPDHAAPYPVRRSGARAAGRAAATPPDLPARRERDRDRRLAPAARRARGHGRDAADRRRRMARRQLRRSTASGGWRSAARSASSA